MKAVFALLLLLPLIANADERSVIPGAAGPNRLDPDVTVLSRGKRLQYSDGRVLVSGLEDLRLHDSAGVEVPYLIVPPSTKADVWLGARVLPVASTKTTSGFEADLGAIRNVDRIRIAGVAAPFMKRLKLEGSGDRVHYNVLADDATLFDLPEEKLKNLDVTFAPGEYRYVRVTWNDRTSAVVRSVGSVEARLVSNGESREEARVPVAFRRVSSEPGKSRYRVQLPGPRLPVAAIELVVANENVLRSASVAESRLTGSQVVPVDLGSAQLRKASREGAIAADLAIPISFPEGADLDLVVTDGNNPPLSVERVEAKLAPLPWIYFESADGKELRASYGNASLEAPRYDLEAKRKSIAGARVAVAKWGAAAIAVTPQSTTSALVLKGAPVKAADYRFTRAIPAAPAGPSRLRLDVEVLAHSRDTADVRVIDRDSNQVPYLVERCAEPIVLDLEVPARTDREGHSVYTLALPYDTLPPNTALVFTTSGRVFTRSVLLQRPADESGRNRFAQTLASTAWSNADPDHDAPPLRVDADLRGSKSVDLVIDEGDNAPLPISSAKLLIPAVALRFYSPGGALKLLYGNGSAAAPRYDIELLASRVFAEPARELTLAAAVPRAVETPRELRYFWIAIVGAVVVLLAVLAKLIGSRAADH